jgi:hypothetical protein
VRFELRNLVVHRRIARSLVAVRDQETLEHRVALGDDLASVQLLVTTQQTCRRPQSRSRWSSAEGRRRDLDFGITDVVRWSREWPQHELNLR